MRVAPPHGRSNHPSEAERIWLWTARTRWTARNAKNAAASPTIHPILPGLRGRGSPAFGPGTARVFTKASCYGTLGAVKKAVAFLAPESGFA